MSSDGTSGSSTTPGDIFATTRWTVVLTAGARASPQADQALEELCCTYWFPLYAYVRRHGHAKEDAEDLVQGFFERFLQKNYLEGLNRDRGRFRAFLLASLKHFLANEYDKVTRQKRGGHAPHLSLDWAQADTRFHLAPSDKITPDRAYDREWALALLNRVIGRLGSECAAEGKEELFDQLKVYLTVGKGAVPYARAAAETGVTEGALRVTVHRMRRRYRQLLRDEIAQTLSDPAQVEDELQSLFAALSE